MIDDDKVYVKKASTYLYRGNLKPTKEFYQVVITSKPEAELFYNQIYYCGHVNHLTRKFDKFNLLLGKQMT